MCVWGECEWGTEKREGKLASSVYITTDSLKLCYSSALWVISTLSYFRFADISTSLSVWSLDSYQRIFIFNHLMNWWTHGGLVGFLSLWTVATWGGKKGGQKTMQEAKIGEYVTKTEKLADAKIFLRINRALWD